jgi:WD40 repeat protein
VTFADSSKLVWLQYRIHDRSAVSRSDFEPPSNFVVTSTGFIEESSQMILGSREGVIALYDVGDTSDPGFGPALLCVRDAHDREAVTSILTFKFPGDSQPPQTHILTTGRDCYYSLHKIKTPKDTSPTLEIETVHRSSPPTRIVLEGASMDPSTGVLILTGFRGVHFVVWNESTQTELVAVDCGGGHRTWVHHSGMDGSFLVWTRAGNLNIFSRTDSAYRALRVGGHGREVKTMAISPSIGTGGEINRTILATGSEDTCIRLFLLDEEPRSRPCGSFQSVRTLKPSNTGLQHLQWSSDARWLFSSAGNEDFDTWRVRYMPGFGIGVVREGNYPKSQAISELRITHFEAVEVDVGETDMDAFLIFMGYSNSEVKVRL